MGWQPWALCLGGAWSCLLQVGLVSVTDEDGWSGLSSYLSDVRRTSRLVTWSALMREVVILAKGKGENQSYLTGVQRETPRFVAWWYE